MASLKAVLTRSTFVEAPTPAKTAFFNSFVRSLIILLPTAQSRCPQLIVMLAICSRKNFTKISRYQSPQESPNPRWSGPFGVLKWMSQKFICAKIRVVTLAQEIQCSQEKIWFWWTAALLPSVLRSEEHTSEF